MTAYLKGRAVSQVTEILMNGRLYEETEIREALKKVPVKKKKDKK